MQGCRWAWEEVLAACTATHLLWGELSDTHAPPKHLVLQFEELSYHEGQTVTAAASAFVPAVDHSRVELSLITSDEDSCYINANFIKVLLLSWCFTVQRCLWQLLVLPGRVVTGGAGPVALVSKWTVRSSGLCSGITDVATRTVGERFKNTPCRREAPGHRARDVCSCWGG